MMHPTSPNTGRLPTLLLFLLLFRPGLQGPVPSQAATRLLLTTKISEECKALIQEICTRLQKPSGDIDNDDKVQLRNKSFWRPNLSAFKKAQETLADFQDIRIITRNLEKLDKCLPEATATPTTNSIFIKGGDADDFRKKLRYYLQGFLGTPC